MSGMTRARDTLKITYSVDNDMDNLAEIINNLCV